MRGLIFHFFPLWDRVWCLALNSHLCSHEYTNLICIIVKSIPALTSFSLLKSKAWPVMQRHKQKFIPPGVSLFFTLNLFWYEDSSKELLRAVSVRKTLPSFLLWDFLWKVNNNFKFCKPAHLQTRSNSMHFFLRNRESLSNLRLIHEGLNTERSQSSSSPLPATAGTWELDDFHHQGRRGGGKAKGQENSLCSSHTEKIVWRIAILLSHYGAFASSSYPERQLSFFPLTSFLVSVEIRLGRAENREQQLIVQVFPVQNKLKTSKVKYKTHLPISLFIVLRNGC